jgi:ATP-dependent helicase/nuclease subunit A
MTVGDAEQAIARGRLIHLLLEHLPSVAADGRVSHAKALLALAEDTGEAGDLTEVITDAIRIIDTPSLAPIFAPGTLAEVDLTANISALGNLRLHGTIDRLIITPNRVLAVDFKTNRIVPPSPTEIPEGLLRQMGAYHAMLSQIYADRPIDLAILWTATATMMPIPPDIVIAALQRSTVP